MRICAGLIRSTISEVRVQRQVGYCPQIPGVLDLLTADEHLLLFRPTLGLSATRCSGRADAAGRAGPSGSATARPRDGCPATRTKSSTWRFPPRRRSCLAARRAVSARHAGARTKDGHPQASRGTRPSPEAGLAQQRAEWPMCISSRGPAQLRPASPVGGLAGVGRNATRRASS